MPHHLRCLLAAECSSIQLSLRYKTNDHLWFTFFHEAAHILLHGKKLIFLDTGKNEGNTEKEADNWAADFLIPPKKYQTFLEEGSLSKSSIAEFAGEVGIAPGIVVGRLQHDGLLKFSQCNDLKARFEWVKSRAS